MESCQMVSATRSKLVKSLFILVSILSIIKAQNCTCGRTFIDPRIVGGKNARPNRYPWIVPFFESGSSNIYCTGTLINKQWLISAAHCFQARSWSNLVAYIGTHNLSNPVEQRKLVQVVVHPKYSGIPRRYNDIALVQLDSSISVDSNVNPICLPASESKMGHYFMVAGWGRTGTSRYPNILQEADVELHSDDYCVKAWNVTKYDSTNQLCAGSENGICNNDSGSPLMARRRGRFTLEGITSYEYHPCGSPEFPGVFTRVRSFLDWIKGNLNGQEFCTA